MSGQQDKPSAVPEREGSPVPGHRLIEVDLLHLYREMAKEDAEFLLRRRAKLAAVKRAEWALWVFALSLLAGVLVALAVDSMLSGRVIP